VSELPGTEASAATAQRAQRKERVGIVVSDAADKTIIVRVDRRTTHPLYGKTINRSTKFHAHDERNDAHVGDRVRIAETRPVSKLKRWRLVEVVERAK
jgi:small subunit ribosomal protein S17